MGYVQAPSLVPLHPEVLEFFLSLESKLRSHMDDRKIGLTIFLLREDRISVFAEKLLRPNEAALIPLAEPLMEVSFRFLQRSTASRTGCRQWTLF